MKTSQIRYGAKLICINARGTLLEQGKLYRVRMAECDSNSNVIKVNVGGYNYNVNRFAFPEAVIENNFFS